MQHPKILFTYFLIITPVLSKKGNFNCCTHYIVMICVYVRIIHKVCYIQLWGKGCNHYTGVLQRLINFAVFCKLLLIWCMLFYKVWV